MINRDLPPPTDFDGLNQGWDYNVARGASPDAVYRAWSRRSSHGEGLPPRDEHAGSRRAIALFSTRQLALEALREEIVLKQARELARIDEWILAEQRTGRGR